MKKFRKFNGCSSIQEPQKIYISRNFVCCGAKNAFFMREGYGISLIAFPAQAGIFEAAYRIDPRFRGESSEGRPQENGLLTHPQNPGDPGDFALVQITVGKIRVEGAQFYAAGILAE